MLHSVWNRFDGVPATFPLISFLSFLGILVLGYENSVMISLIRMLEIAAYCTVCEWLLMEYDVIDVY